VGGALTLPSGGLTVEPPVPSGMAVSIPVGSLPFRREFRFEVNLSRSTP
jgi:hypothetical protein